MKILKSYCLAVVMLGLSQSAAYAETDQQTMTMLRQIASGYERGRDVKQDYQQAFSLYCTAALMGDAESAYSMGFMYFNGRGVERNLPLAVTWFKKAADGGDSHAKQMLARFNGVDTTDDQACKPIAPPMPILVADANPDRQIVENWVKQIAPHYGIDPDLVLAVIKAESAFNPTALSNKNAQGLMQLIPATAERFGVKDSWDPIQNIKGGTAYLHWLLRHFEGKVDLVLAAYNAGEGAVERYHGIPPFQETQHYVKQILSWYSKPMHPVPPEQPENFSIQQKT